MVDKSSIPPDGPNFLIIIISINLYYNIGIFI
jgi:hypothetical protein